MMIILPGSLGWFIVIVVVSTIVLNVVTTLETTRLYSRWERKQLKAREEAVAAGELAIRQARNNLGRKAHDAATQLRVAQYELDDENDTTIQMEPLR